MEFLTSGIWWALFIPTVISFSAYQLGRTGSGSLKNQLQTIGGLLTLVLIVLTFVFSGWQGGVATMIGVIPASVIGLIIIRSKTRPT